MLPLKKDFLLRFKKPNKSSLPNFNSSENLQYLPQIFLFSISSHRFLCDFHIISTEVSKNYSRKLLSILILYFHAKYIFTEKTEFCEDNLVYNGNING